MIGALAIFASVGFAAVCAEVDAEHLRDNDYIESHTSRAAQRAYFFLAMGISDWVWVFGSALLFYAVFDQVLNYLMGKKLFYLGETAKTDIFFNKHKWLYLPVKILAFVFGVTLFFI